MNEGREVAPHYPVVKRSSRSVQQRERKPRSAAADRNLIDAHLRSGETAGVGRCEPTRISLQASCMAERSGSHEGAAYIETRSEKLGSSAKNFDF